jgi:hypothetical protein
LKAVEYREEVTVALRRDWPIIVIAKQHFKYSNKPDRKLDG